jgi:hypothetical protein
MHAAALKLHVRIPDWFTSLVTAPAAEETPKQEASPEPARPDRDAEWLEGIREQLSSYTKADDVIVLRSYQSTRTVLDRLARERPELAKQADEMFAQREAALRGAHDAA